MPVQVICKSYKDPIKSKQALYVPDKVKYGVFQHPWANS